MSDDLNRKIKQLTDILGQDTVPDNLKGLLSLFANSLGSQDSPQKPAEAPVFKDEKPARVDQDDSFEMIRKVKKMMDRANTMNDPRVNLLNAIRPFLNNKRQKKINDCMKILQMASLTRLIDDQDK